MKSFLKIFIINFILLLAACESFIDMTLEGNGKVETSSRNIDEKFNSISLREDFDLELYQYNKDSISVIAEYNLIPFINVHVKDERLIIRNNENKKFLTNYRVILKLYLKELSYIENLYQGRMIADSLNLKSLTLYQSEKGLMKINYLFAKDITVQQYNRNDIFLNGDFNNVKIEQSGSGDLVIKGSSFKTSVSQNGSGIINLYNLNSSLLNIVQDGSGIAYCSVDSIFDVDIIGGGRVFYKGNPQINSKLSNENYLIKEYN